MDLPFSQAAENNSEAILVQLRALLANARSVLEIGAGTGQHASAFAAAMPQLCWQPSEHPDALNTLRPRCEKSALKNLGDPIALDICHHTWPDPWPDAVYTANTLHIVAKDVVEKFFTACGERAKKDSLLIIYGPFNYNGQYTSQSNANFDLWLKDRSPASAIRDVEWVQVLATGAGFTLQADTAMPANNRLLVWRKIQD